MNFDRAEDYFAYINSIPLPKGISGSSLDLSFSPEELKNPGEKGHEFSMNLTLIIADKPVRSFSALFTRNAFPGHPVIIGRELIEKELLKGLIINNKIANVECPHGYERSQAVRTRVEELIPGEGVIFPFSTGIIGWELPAEAMLSRIPDLVKSLKSGAALPLARSIMTTDSFPKVHSVEVGEGRITGICKGAGMIEPHLATMLVFVMTDLDIPKRDLKKYWKNACEMSFNRISIDSDQSTSDTAFIFSTGKVACNDINEFGRALEGLTEEMAQSIVRNGEGTSHVIEVIVEDALTEEEAVSAGKAIINSPLTKSAIFGNDPNVGRIIQALGDWAGLGEILINRKDILIRMGEIDLYRDGAFLLNGSKEVALHKYLQERALPLPSPGFPAHDKNVKIIIRLGRGNANARVWGSDLSNEYVTINAEYRS